MQIEPNTSKQTGNAMAFSRASEEDACHVVTRDVTTHRSYSEPHIHRVAMETSCALHRWESSPGHLSADQCYFVLAAPPCLSVRSVGTQTVQETNAERQRSHTESLSRSEGPLPDLVQARSLTTDNLAATTTEVGRMLRRMADDFDSTSNFPLYQPVMQGLSVLCWIRDLYRLIFR